VGGDPGALARDWAEARGLARPRLRAGTTALAAVVGAVPGAGFAGFVVFGMSSEAFAQIFTRTGDDFLELPMWLILSLYVVGGAFAVAGALASAVRR
jgi:hypothetical protein